MEMQCRNSKTIAEMQHRGLGWGLVLLHLYLFAQGSLDKMHSSPYFLLIVATASVAGPWSSIGIGGTGNLNPGLSLLSLKHKLTLYNSVFFLVTFPDWSSMSCYGFSAPLIKRSLWVPRTMQILEFLNVDNPG